MEDEKLIQDYLHNRLSDDQQREFKHLMETDSTFQQNVRDLQALHGVMKADEMKGFSTILEEAEKEVQQGQFRGRIIVIVALVALLLFSIFYLKNSWEDDALYADFYEAPANTYYPILRDANASNLPIYKAFLAYEQQDYAQASERIATLPEFQASPELQFYHAISISEMGQVEMALAELELIGTTNDDELNSEVQWYSALFLFKLGREEEAKSILSQMELSEKRMELLARLR